ncbi:MAG: fused MFS/spermidine synthase [Devosia sp.]
MSALQDPVHAVPSPAVRLAMPVYAATLFLSAFLLFSIQPFFTKLALPRLGGSPAVWSIAMVFFQAVLLLGYFYAHLLARIRDLRVSAAIHLLVLASAFVVLPIAIPAGWERPPETGQAVWLLALLAVSVGLPFFAVSANSTMLQAWFSRSAHPRARDPYFLYGASNIGSFASLILYIVLIEPVLTLPQQSMGWTIGYGLLGLMIAGCAALVNGRAGTAAASGAAPKAKPLALRSVAAWIALGFVPSGLLVAVTSHITTDVASAPFLWVAPLALFLLTFVLVFRTRPLVSTELLKWALPLLAAPVLMNVLVDLGWPVWIPVLLHLAFFLVAALYCHSVLYALRPEVEKLTIFYLFMSLGGVLGGAFASLLAPLVFNWIAEYPILIVASLFVGRIDRRHWRSVGVAVVAALAFSLLAGIFLPQPEALFASRSLAVAAVIAALFVAQFRWRDAVVPLAAAVLPLIFLQQAAVPNLFKERSFFGVSRVQLAEQGTYLNLAHGTTLHGSEHIRNADGSAVTGRPIPLTYYHSKGGIAASIQLAQERTQEAGRFGIVGLGAGSVACYARPGEHWSFYEIDRSVVRAARDAGLFHFLPECGPQMPIILGDARLTLSEEADGAFDYLLIDAFSSDSIPTHLMTQEALALYRAKVGANGIIALHISNRYLELGSVLAATAAALNLPIRIGQFPADPELPGSQAAIVAIITSDAEALAMLDADPRWARPDSGGVAPWTDDYSNIVAALLRRAQN